MSTSSLNLSGILSSINDAFSGKTSGIDVQATVAQLMQIQRQPEAAMQQQQATIAQQVSLLGGISNHLQTLYTAANSLQDLTGGINAKIASSSQSSIVTASADVSAAIGNHSVVVGNLATISSSYSDPVPSSQQLGGAEIDVAYGDPHNPSSTDKILIPSADNTVQQVADYINTKANNFGVTASVVTDAIGSRLAFTSKTGGAAGNLTVSSAALNFTQGMAGLDATLTVDGVPVDSASNTVSGALQGVTLNLAGAAPDTAVTLSVAPDSSQITQTISDFVSAYNAVISDLNGQFAVDANGHEGSLGTDAGIRTLQARLLSAISYSVSGTGQYVNLQSLGLEMQNDGTLQLNNSVLNDAISNHYQDLQNFFQSLTPQGFGNFFGTQMTQLTDPTEGPVAVDIAGLQQTNQSLTNDINSFEARMTLVQQQLTNEYAQLNTALQQYPILQQQIAAQLGALTTTKTG